MYSIDASHLTGLKSPHLKTHVYKLNCGTPEKIKFHLFNEK